MARAEHDTERVPAAGAPAEAAEAVRYESEVVEVGGEVPSFVAAGVLVWFHADAPEELRWFSVLHRPTTTTGGVAPGDVIWIDDHALRVTAVGEVANQNLVQLGHLDLKANGALEAPLPGDVCVEQGPLPPVRVGTRLRIVAGSPRGAGDPDVKGQG